MHACTHTHTHTHTHIFLSYSIWHSDLQVKWQCRVWEDERVNYKSMTNWGGKAAYLLVTPQGVQLRKATRTRTTWKENGSSTGEGTWPWNFWFSFLVLKVQRHMVLVMSERSLMQCMAKVGDVWRSIWHNEWNNGNESCIWSSEKLAASGSAK